MKTFLPHGSDRVGLVLRARKLERIVALALILQLGSSRVARAGDHENLDDNLPVTLTDAYPTNYLNREVQGVLRYQRTDAGDDIMFIQPRFELGYPRNTQLSVALPVVSKLGDSTRLGTFRAEILYNLNQETLVLPAFALVGALDAPSGRDAEGERNHGVDPIVRGFLTKTLPGSTYWHRVHVNGSYQFNTDRQSEERKGHYTLAAGYSFRLTAGAIGVFDYVRQQQRKKGAVQNFLELGVRTMVNPLLVLSAGLSVGVGEQSSPVRVTAGVQYRAF